LDTWRIVTRLPGEVLDMWPNSSQHGNRIHRLHGFPPARRDLEEIRPPIGIGTVVVTRGVEERWVEEHRVALCQFELDHGRSEDVDEFGMAVGGVAVVKVLGEREELGGAGNQGHVGVRYGGLEGEQLGCDLRDDREARGDLLGLEAEI
jgi:hypothetical protein